MPTTKYTIKSNAFHGAETKVWAHSTNLDNLVELASLLHGSLDAPRDVFVVNNEDGLVDWHNGSYTH